MTERERLEQDIAILRQSISIYRGHLKQESARALNDTLQAIAWCKIELSSLETDLRKLSKSSSYWR